MEIDTTYLKLRAFIRTFWGIVYFILNLLGGLVSLPGHKLDWYNIFSLTKENEQGENVTVWKYWNIQAGKIIKMLFFPLIPYINVNFPYIFCSERNYFTVCIQCKLYFQFMHKGWQHNKNDRLFSSVASKPVFQISIYQNLLRREIHTRFNTCFTTTYLAFGMPYVL